MKSGLHIPIETPYLGTSPDDIFVKDYINIGLLEIKCLYSTRNLNEEEIIKDLS